MCPPFFGVDFVKPSTLTASHLALVNDEARSCHVAIIMDGNGRWARARTRPRAVGHVAGARTVRHIVEAAPSCGITTLTLYAFSSDNWRRPKPEVQHLMRLFERHLRAERDRLVEHGVRLSIIGRRDRVSGTLRRRIERVEHDTGGGASLHLRVAIDYSGRDAILAAASRLPPQQPSAEGPAPSRAEFEHALALAMHAPTTDAVDLLIRTGGEQRLSDFLLWEVAYAELLFTNTLWPDFTETELKAAMRDFHARDRRFGRLPSPPGGSVPTHPLRRVLP